MKEELEKILNSKMNLEEKVKALMILKKFPEKGMAFCVHHDLLVDYCVSFEERIKVILTTKPSSQHLTRLLNFTFIPRNHLPKDVKRLVDQFLDRPTWAPYDTASIFASYDTAFILMECWKEKTALLNKLSPENTWNGKNIGLEES